MLTSDFAALNVNTLNQVRTNFYKYWFLYCRIRKTGIFYGHFLKSIIFTTQHPAIKVRAALKSSDESLKPRPRDRCQIFKRRGGSFKTQPQPALLFFSFLFQSIMNKAWFRKRIQRTAFHRRIPRSPRTSTPHSSSLSGATAGQKHPGRASGQGPPLPSPACGRTASTGRPGEPEPRAESWRSAVGTGNSLNTITGWTVRATLPPTPPPSGALLYAGGWLSPGRWNKSLLHVPRLSRACSPGISRAAWMRGDSVSAATVERCHGGGQRGVFEFLHVFNVRKWP